MLRKIRLTLAVIIFTMTTLLFLDFTGATHCWLGWIAKMQFLPAFIGGEYWGCIGIIGINLTLWTCLLFGYLSVRRISRCCFLDSRKTQKESFLLFPGSLMVTLWNVRNFYYRFFSGYRFSGGSIRSVWSLWTNSLESFCSFISMGK